MALCAPNSAHRSWPLVAYYDFSSDRTAREELRRLVACKESEPSERREPELQKRVFALDSTRLCVLKKPCTVIMRDFDQKRHSTDREWKSDPFYTKPEGYKMCLSVYANGAGEGRGTHVSAFIRLMWGEYDYNLIPETSSSSRRTNMLSLPEWNGIELRSFPHTQLVCRVCPKL